MADLKFADTHNIVAFLSKPEESDGFEQIVDFLNAHPIKKQRPRKPKRKDTEIPQSNVADKAVNKEMDDSLVRAATTASSLEAEQDSGNINKTQSKATLNEPNPQGIGSGSGLRRQDTIGDIIAQTGFEMYLKHPMTYCSQERRKEGQEITSSKDYTSLSRRVESSDKASLGDEEDASKQGRIADIDAAKDIYLVNVHRDEDMFRVNDLEGDEVVVETEFHHEVDVETEVASKDVNLTDVDMTLAQALAELKSVKPKADKVVLQEPEQGIITTTAASTRPNAKGLVIHEEEQATTPIVSSQQSSQVKVQDKGKGIIVEEPLKMKKKVQINFDQQEAIRLQAEFDEEERLAREKDQKKQETNIQEELTNAEKATLFVQVLEKRRKHFAAKRAKEKRNIPPTKAQKRSIMSTYLKNIAGYKPNQLKNKSFDDIQKLFDKAMKRVNTFVNMDTELVEGTEMKESSKKAKVMEESSKRQKGDDDQEAAKMKELMKIVPDEEEVAIDAIPLATKPPSIMLKSFDREDLEILWKLVKAKHGSIRPEKGYERVLWGDLKIMFEHHVEDTVFLSSSQNNSRINEVFGSIILVIMKLSMKKLEILKINIKFRGGLLGLKDFLMILELLLLRSFKWDQHIHNENQLKFNSIKDAKQLLEVVKKRFGRNAATKKTQRNLLKQQYENFTTPSSEMLDQTFDRLQKLVSQLELLDEKLLQEDVNQKLLRSLSPEWNTHVVV
ncbi:hypothetical protein Tco_0882269 [Tanacetum coccineum]